MKYIISEVQKIELPIGLLKSTRVDVEGWADNRDSPVL